MLDSLKTLFTGGVSGGERRDAKHTIQLATAALLLEVSRADFEIQDEELATIAEALRDQFGFSEAETATLLESALEESHESISVHPFVRLVNEEFSVEQKRQVIEAMWRVAYADRRLDKYEEHQIRKIAELLYLSHADFIRAKLKVIGENGARAR